MDRAALARMAVGHSLFAPQSLNAAISQLGYVQADPIRAPARAQDLILRHRVTDYRIDELEARYPELDVMEDMLHNYGFFPSRHHSLLYPRRLYPRRQLFVDEHRALRRKVLRFLEMNEAAHPRDVERAVGAAQRVNGWGGTSSASTMMLDTLHREGRARVLRREAGIRVYARAEPVLASAARTPTQRADAFIHLLVNLYAPMPLRSLKQTISMAGGNRPSADYDRRIALMLQRGELEQAEVDGLTYVWLGAANVVREPDDAVRLLAPFDPVVWDRRRFEHLWGWAYRFEAYTPAAKRKLGYYALPLLWRDAVIGWANVSVTQRPTFEFGYVNKKPRDAAYREALGLEVDRLKVFLRC